MGNSPSGPRFLGNGKYCSYHVKIDNAATITVTKDQQKSELKYEVDGMTCTLSISRSLERISGDENISISLTDSFLNIPKYSTVVPSQSASIYVSVKKEKKSDGFLCSQFGMFDIFSMEANTTREGVSRRGEVETKYWAYGCGTRMGLLVTEKKKKKSDEKQVYMATVAHYYVNSGSGRNDGGDIGFSVVVKIGVHNGELDFSVDGPVEHPSSALLYMIDEVIRTGTWKLSSCPHCKNIQSQRRWLSETEDSDTTLPPPPPPPHYGGSQNAANIGRFNGDGIGSIIQATKVNFIKWWK
ncbi:uncharacterized protein [Phaseolus vulgaris]|uniref:uncharacterized protein n=1 Tax=Phaseolus vulgaris TaxID=3885 RepID=UPI0035CA2C6C